MIFSNTFDANGKFHWQVLCRIAPLNIFGKLTGRSASVHKKDSTVDILLGFINERLLEKMLWYDKSMGPFKTCHSGKRGGKVDKKRNKKWGRGRVRSQKIWFHSLKKTRFCEWRSFLMAPMIMFYFAVFFMSVFFVNFMANSDYGWFLLA